MPPPTVGIGRRPAAPVVPRLLQYHGTLSCMHSSSLSTVKESSTLRSTHYESRSSLFGSREGSRTPPARAMCVDLRYVESPCSHVVCVTSDAGTYIWPARFGSPLRGPGRRHTFVACAGWPAAWRRLPCSHLEDPWRANLRRALRPLEGHRQGGSQGKAKAPRGAAAPPSRTARRA